MSIDDLSRYSLQTDDDTVTNLDINAGYWDAMIRSLRDRLQSATQSWEACGRERDALRKERDEANAEIEGYLDQIQHYQAAITQHEKALGEASSEIKQLKAANDRLDVENQRWTLEYLQQDDVPASDPVLDLASRLDQLEERVNGVVAVDGRWNREQDQRIAAVGERLTFCLEAFDSVAAKMDHPRIVALLRPGTGEPAHWASNIREGGKP